MFSPVHPRGAYNCFRNYGPLVWPRTGAVTVLAQVWPSLPLTSPNLLPRVGVRMPRRNSAPP